MNYYIEKLKVVKDKEWREPDVNTLTWVRASGLIFDSVEEAKAFIDFDCNTRSDYYRITDGEQIWQA